MRHTQGCPCKSRCLQLIGHSLGQINMHLEEYGLFFQLPRMVKTRVKTNTTVAVSYRGRFAGQSGSRYLSRLLQLAAITPPVGFLFAASGKALSGLLRLAVGLSAPQGALPLRPPCELYISSSFIKTKFISYFPFSICYSVRPSLLLRFNAWYLVFKLYLLLLLRVREAFCPRRRPHSGSMEL